MRSRKALARCLCNLAGRGVRLAGRGDKGADREPDGESDHLAHIVAHYEPDGRPENLF